MKTAAVSLKKIQETTLVWWCLVVLVALVSLYLYYVNAGVRNVVLREKTERETALVASRLSDLEFEHRKLSDTITLDYAHSLGFAEVSAPLFASREAGAAVVSFNTKPR